MCKCFLLGERAVCAFPEYCTTLSNTAFMSALDVVGNVYYQMESCGHEERLISIFSHITVQHMTRILSGACASAGVSVSVSGKLLIITSHVHEIKQVGRS